MTEHYHRIILLTLYIIEMAHGPSLSYTLTNSGPVWFLWLYYINLETLKYLNVTLVLHDNIEFTEAVFWDIPRDEDNHYLFLNVFLCRFVTRSVMLLFIDIVRQVLGEDLLTFVSLLLSEVLVTIIIVETGIGDAISFRYSKYNNILRNKLMNG